MRSVAGQQPALSVVEPMAHPVGLYGIVVVDAADGAIIVGAPTGVVVGSVGTVIVAPKPDVPASEFGPTKVVGGLTPGLLIWNELRGTPARAAPPGVIGVVDVVEAVVVLSHPGVPDPIMEVPASGGAPDVTAPIDVPVVAAAMVPIAVPVDVGVVPVVNPPPSNAEVEPEIGVVGGVMIEHGDPVLTMPEVPVVFVLGMLVPFAVPYAPEPIGLTPGVVISVEPSGSPVGATVSPVIPRGEVASRLGTVVVSICAKAEFQPNSTEIVSASNARRMSHLFFKQTESVRAHDPGRGIARDELPACLSQLAAL
jgi:hypothetical protein